MYMYSDDILYYYQLFYSTFYVKVLMLFLKNITVSFNYCSTNLLITLHRHENKEVNFSHTISEQFVIICSASCNAAFVKVNIFLLLKIHVYLA